MRGLELADILNDLSFTEKSKPVFIKAEDGTEYEIDKVDPMGVDLTLHVRAVEQDFEGSAY